MKTTSCTFRNVSASFYLASLLWCFLFPLVSITTGEFKPRGLYLDENALLVSRSFSGLLSKAEANKSHINFEKFFYLTKSMLKIESFEEQYCSYLKSNFLSVSCHRLTKSMGGITQINVDHPWKPRSLEVTAVPILYHVSNKLQSFAFATAVVHRLISSDWLSKRVLILLIPLEEINKKSANREDNIRANFFCAQKWEDNSGCDSDSNSDSDRRYRGGSGTRYSASLSDWLDEYHNPRSLFLGTSTDNDVMLHAGLLRDSYVMDFSEPMITTLPNHILTERRESSQPKVASFWIKIQLLVAGNNGQLPNMDILAAPLAAFPDIIISEADQLPAVQGGGGVCALPPRSFMADACHWCSLLLKAHNCDQYYKVLLGLFSFSEALVRGPTGLHGQFIRRNIDSLTLRPIASHADGSGVARRMSNTGQPLTQGGLEGAIEGGTDWAIEGGTDWAIEGGTDWAIEDLAGLVTMVEHCVHYSSNLHGERCALS
jgi:hypothetical protein